MGSLDSGDGHKITALTPLLKQPHLLCLPGLFLNSKVYIGAAYRIGITSSSYLRKQAESPWLHPLTTGFILVPEGAGSSPSFLWSTEALISCASETYSNLADIAQKSKGLWVSLNARFQGCVPNEKRSYMELMKYGGFDWHPSYMSRSAHHDLFSFNWTIDLNIQVQILRRSTTSFSVFAGRHEWNSEAGWTWYQYRFVPPSLLDGAQLMMLSRRVYDEDHMGSHWHQYPGMYILGFYFRI